jgi:HPt (histidine-containing phosphotransfer) domain-containing protein
MKRKLTPTDPMERLHRDYEQQLPKQIAQLFLILADYQLNRPQAWQDALRLAHSLAGSAGTYGYNELGVLLGELEIWLETTKPASANLASIRTQIGVWHERCRALLPGAMRKGA